MEELPNGFELFSAQRVRELRIEKSLSQAGLAEATKGFDPEGKGIHSQSVVWLETGRHKSPSVRTLELLKAPLGVDYWVI